MKKIFSSFLTLLAFLFLVSSVSAAAPDGSGPWADSVVSSSQGNMKNGSPVPAIRSNPSSAVGVAENNTIEGNFFSLGFGGVITLSFDNGVRDGIIVIEATNPEYPQEQARVEVSADNVSWTTAGLISQDATLGMPENLSCIKYVRITDMSNLENFTDDTADGFDVDGVSTENSEACEPTVTPTPSDTITPTPTQTPNNNNDGGSNNNNNSTPQVCTASKPGTPTINSVTRTSGSTVQLTWSAVQDATTYAISYGTQSGNYQYGVPSTGNTTTYSIGGLDANATYYFVVRAIRDCMPGDNSGQSSTGGQQVLGTTTSSGQVLGASTDVLAATGNGIQTIALSLSILSGILAFGFSRVSKSN